MTTIERPIFLLNESIRIDSHNESNRIDLNRELECSNASYDHGVMTLCPCLSFKSRCSMEYGWTDRARLFASASFGQSYVRTVRSCFVLLCSTSCFITLSSYLVGKWHKEAFSRERRRRRSTGTYILCSKEIQLSTK